MKKSVMRKKLHKYSRGMAMTEVIIAFLILTIIFAIMYNSIRFASNMMMRAAEMDRQNTVFEEKAAAKFTGVSDPYSSSSLGADVEETHNITLTFVEQVDDSESVTPVTCQFQVAGKVVKILDGDGTTRLGDVKIYSTDP